MKILNLFCCSILLTLSLVAQESYYSYSVEDLEKDSSSFTLDNQSLERWNQILDDYFDKQATNHYLKSSFFTYLYTAQRDFIFLAHELTGSFEGSLDPISLKISTLFFPDFPTPSGMQKDCFSVQLAEVVFAKYEQRFEKEQKRVQQVEAKKAQTKWLFWLLKREILPPAPKELQSSAGIRRQVEILKERCKGFTKEDEEDARFWAGLKGRGSGDWREIANRYMQEQKVPFAKRVLVRSNLMMALSDGAIDALIAKYHFGIARPPVTTPELTPLVPLPTTPSYPSRHAVIAAVAETVLSYYFPSGHERFVELAHASALSRICARVHYPLDREAGLDLGKEIGREALVQISAL